MEKPNCVLDLEKIIKDCTGVGSTHLPKIHDALLDLAEYSVWSKVDCDGCNYKLECPKTPEKMVTLYQDHRRMDEITDDTPYINLHIRNLLRDDY